MPADTRAFQPDVPRQGGPVSAPFVAPARRGPGQDSRGPGRDRRGPARDQRPAPGPDRRGPGQGQPPEPGLDRRGPGLGQRAEPEVDRHGPGLGQREEPRPDRLPARGLRGRARPPAQARDLSLPRRAPASGAQAVAGVETGSRRQRLAAPAEGARPRSRRARTGAEPARRRGTRLGGPKAWLWLSTGVVVLFGVVAVAMTLLRTGPTGPAHTLTTPARLGAFSRSTQLTRQMDVGQLEKNIIAQSSGQASHLVSAVYQAGSPVSGGSPAEVMLFIGGQLSGASPTASVKSFTQHFRDAVLTGAGSLGGEAACVAGQSATGGSTVCAWFDNDTFGELVSPNMSVTALANELRAMRPSVEHVVR
jgi:hypothetical protein